MAKHASNRFDNLGRTLNTYLAADIRHSRFGINVPLIVFSGETQLSKRYEVGAVKLPLRFAFEFRFLKTIGGVSLYRATDKRCD